MEIKKAYVEPEVSIEQIDPADVIATSYETPWEDLDNVEDKD